MEEDITLRPANNGMNNVAEEQQLDITIRPSSGDDITVRPAMEEIGMPDIPMPAAEVQVAVQIQDDVLDPNHCSFCGAPMSSNDNFCPECGEHRGQLRCPICHAMSSFAFCTECGSPITQEAIMLAAKADMDPEYQKLLELTEEYEKLLKTVTEDSQRQREQRKMNDDLRKRVMSLLAELDGDPEPEVKPLEAMTLVQKEEKQRVMMREIAKQLQKLSVPENITSPAVARNQQMAYRPRGVRSGWVCNFKHEKHPSPCACAHPEMGGHWVLDDNKK